jgi:hypothetical protein
VGGVAVPKRVWRHPFLDAGSGDGPLHGVLTVLVLMGLVARAMALYFILSVS